MKSFELVKNCSLSGNDESFWIFVKPNLRVDKTSDRVHKQIKVISLFLTEVSCLKTVTQKLANGQYEKGQVSDK